MATLRPHDIMQQAEQFEAWRSRLGRRETLTEAFDHWASTKDFPPHERDAIWLVVRTNASNARARPPTAPWLGWEGTEVVT